MQRLWWVAAWGLALFGCSNDDGEPNYEQGRQAFCRGLCDLAQRCGLTDSACAARCLEEYDPRGVRGTTLSAMGDCIRSSDCSILDNEEALTACAEKAAREEPLRDGLIAYCESAAENYFRCNVLMSVEQCTQAQGFWEDRVLDAAKFCHLGSCEAMRACEQAVFDDPP